SPSNPLPQFERGGNRHGRGTGSDRLVHLTRVQGREGEQTILAKKMFCERERIALAP
ncbi:MAG: hypothetical protein H0W83_00250, partial [Planctomycetes bacterium]|nr:hypothetical protein [Planctomycetota bacterium]